MIAAVTSGEEYHRPPQQQSQGCGHRTALYAIGRGASQFFGTHMPSIRLPLTSLLTSMMSDSAAGESRAVLLRCRLVPTVLILNPIGTIGTKLPSLLTSKCIAAGGAGEASGFVLVSHIGNAIPACG